METLKFLDKMIQSLNVEIGDYALRQKKGQKTLHSDKYYIELIACREYLKNAKKALLNATKEAFKIDKDEIIN